MNEYKKSKELLFEYIRKECVRRRQLYMKMTPLPGDSPERVEAKQKFCLLQLRAWSQDRVQMVKDVGWSPDPRGRFGGKGGIPAGLAPPRMVPLLLYPKQKELIETLRRMDETHDSLHLNIVKSRQVAATTFLLDDAKNDFLFTDSFKLLLGSYAEDVIDGGGKGHREGDSLFARLRMMLDAFMWCFTPANYSPKGSRLSVLRFNQHRSMRWQQEQLKKDNVCMLGESDDMKMRLKRPRWVIFGAEYFTQALGNVARGKLPSDQFSKSDTFSRVIMDEFGEYHKIGAGVDKKARDAAIPCCDHIVTLGTIPEGGGAASHFKQLADKGQSLTLINLEIDWTDIGNYMVGAFYSCQRCNPGNPLVDDQPFEGKKSAYGKPVPGPGTEGVYKVCEHCGHKQLVTRESLSSPYFEMVKDELNYDIVAISRYYRRNWYASVGDRAFPGFVRERAIIPRVIDSAASRTVIGYDPGHSEENPHAFVVVRFNEDTQMPTVIGAHMAANWPIQKFVPFFKRWHPGHLSRKVIMYGSPEEVGRTFAQMYQYRPEEIELMKRLSEYARNDLHEVMYEADSYGVNRDSGTPAAFDMLRQYGIRFRYTFTKDRADQVSKAQNVWMPRVRIEEHVAAHKAYKKGGYYLTLPEAIHMAKMVSSEGHGDVKYDISAKLPNRFVKHYIDALIYAFRQFPDVAHSRVDSGGVFHVERRQKPEVVNYGGGLEYLS